MGRLPASESAHVAEVEAGLRRVLDRWPSVRAALARLDELAGFAAALEEWLTERGF